MNDSRFSPTVVKDVAQNILSFLKSNATKEGHTYWLFKGNVYALLAFVIYLLTLFMFKFLSLLPKPVIGLI